MCSSGGHNTWLSRQIVRMGFGLALLFTGIAHYRDATGFATYVSKDLGPDWIVGLGQTWGYVLPFLMIVGGLSLTFNLFTYVGVGAAGLALASIPAGMTLKAAMGGIPLGDAMSASMNAYIWILVYLFAVKGTKKVCGGACCGSSCAGCPCGKDNCNCDSGSKCMMCGIDPCKCDTSKKAAPAKSTVKSTAKKTVKKAPAKKIASKM